MLFWHGVPLGVDFRGGTLVDVKFASRPNEDQVRATLQNVGMHNFRIQRLDAASSANELLISLDQKETAEQSLDQGKLKIIAALAGNAPAGKPDLNNASKGSIANYLLEKDPLHFGTDANVRYAADADAVVDYRNVITGGGLNSSDEITAVEERSHVVSMDG